MVRKRGIFFTLDALLAAGIFFFVLILASNYYFSEPSETSVSLISQDMVRVFSQLKINQLDNDYVTSLIQSGEITKTNNTVFEQIGEFWAEGNLELAQNLSREVADSYVPPQLGFGIYIDGDEIFARNKSSSRTLVASRKIISGIAKDKPTDGFAARSFLSSIDSRSFSEYYYFGGFVGQGNITVFIDQVPSDVTLKTMYVELDARSDFDLYINGFVCNSLFEPESALFVADEFNISECLPLINPGLQNDFKFVFQGEIADQFIGGGFIKIEYQSSDFNNNQSLGLLTKHLPDIRGIINLFDSVFIPGTLNSMEAYIHYNAEQNNVTNTLYLTIGNYTVLRIVNATGEGNVTLNDTNLSSIIDYTSFNLNTIPLRVGFENVTFATIFEGAADVALITDSSGSMAWRMDVDFVSGAYRECSDAQFGDPDTRRISVAKCLDKQFAADIINISGNQLGLISFEDSTKDFETVNVTTDILLLNSTVGTSVPLTGYTTGGGTCICCGINSAKDILVQEAVTTTFVFAGSSWNYYDRGFDSVPGNDPSNNRWFDEVYANESDWPAAPAVIGTTNGYVYAPAVLSDIGADLSGTSVFADLWEHVLDVAGPPNDFTSGFINQTGNTYGLGAGHDGWDTDPEDTAGPFGYDDKIDYNYIVGGRLQMDNQQGGSNMCSGRDCSGAYAISVNITPAIFNVLNADGAARLSFDYEWDDDSGNVFEGSDQIWIKARWTSPTFVATYLGSDLDNGDSGSDTDLDIATANNPDNDFSGSYSGDITSLIDAPGTYYLEIGGKLRASASNEYGWWYFDNIQLEVSNSTDHYYYRKRFNISDTTMTRRAFVNVLSDDRAVVYVNGNLIDDDPLLHDGEYWNRGGFAVDGTMLHTGENVIAVEVFNSFEASKFDLEFIGINDSRDKAMLVMTDGQATEDAGCPQIGTPSEEAIQAACDARQDYGITVYSVGYSSSADNNTLKEIAACGEGLFAASDNTAQLEDFYEDVALSIVSATRQSQTIEIEGTLTPSVLYGDSYLEINYTPIVSPPEFNEIGLRFQEEDFTNCTFNVTIPPVVRVADAVVTSYSSEHWTDLVTVDGITIYNLSSFSPIYTGLGDSYVVNVPASYLTGGNHTFTMRTGDAPANSTGCSFNNSVIYTAYVTSSVAYGDVLAKADGCTWTVEFEDNSLLVAGVPPGYSGTEVCNYTSVDNAYNPDDSTDVAVNNLLKSLDFDSNGKVNINIDAADLQIEALYVPNVPSLWGPTIVQVRVWE